VWCVVGVPVSGIMNIGRTTVVSSGCVRENLRNARLASLKPYISTWTWEDDDDQKS